MSSALKRQNNPLKILIWEISDIWLPIQTSSELQYVVTLKKKKKKQQNWGENGHNPQQALGYVTLYLAL